MKADDRVIGEFPKNHHDLHESLDANDFLARLKGMKIDLGELIEPHIDDLEKCAVILGGSIANGSATCESDVDLLVLVNATENRLYPEDAARFHTGNHSEILVYRNGVEFNIYFACLTDLNDLVGCFKGVSPGRYDLKVVDSIPQLEESDLLFLDRLQNGWVVEGEEIVSRWREIFSTELLEVYLAVRYDLVANELFEDAWSYLGGPCGAATRVARQCVEQSILALMATEGLTNQSHKLLLHWCERNWRADIRPRIKHGVELLLSKHELTNISEREFLIEVRSFVKSVRDLLREGSDTRFGVQQLESMINYTTEVTGEHN